MHQRAIDLAAEFLERFWAGEVAEDLLRERARLRFPKWGEARGREEIARLRGDLDGYIADFDPHPELINFIADERLVVAEGICSGRLVSGEVWRADDRVGSRWSAVCEVRDTQLARVAIYTDPDFAEADSARYDWPRGAPGGKDHRRTPPRDKAEMSDLQRRDLAINHFRRMDRGEPVSDTFSPSAELYLPKRGTVRGQERIAAALTQFGSMFKRLNHQPAFVNLVVDGDLVAVEGVTSGTTADGYSWGPGDQEPQAGRWCEILEIRDFAIERCALYLDPDFAGLDRERYPWMS